VVSMIAEGCQECQRRVPTYRFGILRRGLKRYKYFFPKNAKDLSLSITKDANLMSLALFGASSP